MAPTNTLTVHCPSGTQSIPLDDSSRQWDLTELLRQSDLPLNTRCGRRALCDGCLIELVGGSLVAIASGQPVTAEETPLLRACQHRLPDAADVEVRIPARSLLAHQPQVVTSFRCNVSRADAPLWRFQTVPVARLNHQQSLLQAIGQELGLTVEGHLPLCANTGLDQASLPEQTDLPVAVEYRGDCWSVRRLVQSPGAEVHPYGLAVDLGTTTVVVLLVDLATGDVAATASALNAQTHLGDNVLTRIHLCLTDKEKISELQQVVVQKTLAPLLDDVLKQSAVPGEQLVSLAVAGNTTMLHLLAGVDPSPMGMVPFTPGFLDHRMVPLGELPIAEQRPVFEPSAASDATTAATPGVIGRTFSTEPTLHLLPGSAAYIGADITAGVYSSGMAYRSDTCLLVDIGTNGEIVLQHHGHLIGCATAAGPAFEGAGLRSGVRAGTGAISHVRLAGDPIRAETEVIGGGKPIGLCGTGYVDFVAQARRSGLIGPNGRITEQAAGCNLVCDLAPGRGFVVAHGRGKEPIIIAEADIASLLQAKAAIAAGIVCLLRRFELNSNDVDTLYLAGGFGFHMDIDNLIGCGLLPGFHPSQIEVVGNTSLAGAYLSLLDTGAIEAIKRISTAIKIVELNLEPDFESCYIDQLWLP